MDFLVLKKMRKSFSEFLHPGETFSLSDEKAIKKLLSQGFIQYKASNVIEYRDVKKRGRPSKDK